MKALEIQTLNQSIGPVLLGAFLRSSALVLAGAVLVILFRSRTAELRHFVCRGILYGLLLLPVMEFVVPPIRHPSAAFTKAELTMFPDQPIAFSTSGIVSEGTILVRHDGAFPWILLATGVYAFVTCTLLLRLGLNLLRMNGLANSSEPILDADLREVAHDIWLQSLSPYRPRIRISKNIRVPMALGIEQVTILLPAHWGLWSREKVRAALIHEMAHVRRNDPQTAFFGSFTVCLFWLNPLVYWLRRQLVALAEEACDDAALMDFRPEQYARILIDFAAEIGRKGGRLAGASAVAVHRSLIETRLHHILSMRRHAQGRQPLLRALSIAIFLPALYLAASARFDQQQTATAADRTTAIAVATPQEAEQLESQLARDPDNLNLHAALMVFYANEGNEPVFTPHLLWAIKHHPEAPAAAMKVYPRPHSQSQTQQGSQAASNYELVKAAWENALNRFPNSPEIAFHAALFLESRDPQRALDLLTRAAGLSPADSPAQSGYRDAMSVIYAAAVMTDKLGAHINNIAMDPTLASALRNQIESSNDPALLSQAGTTLVRFQQDEEGLALIQKAVELDPTNPKWKEALDSAKAEPVRRQNLDEMMSRQAASGVRIAPDVAEANLVTKVDPQYPPLALEARVSGTVEFTVGIGTDGKIQSLRLERGHPLLVNAAKDAVLHWVYRPTLLNGKPVPVTTTVDVPFTIPQQ